MAFRVTGASELIRKLQALPADVAQTSLQAAVLKAAEPIRDRMATLAPRGDPASPNISNIVINRVRATDPLTAGAWIGPSRDAYYAYFQEYGTRYHAAQPFARPAFDSEHPAAQAALADAIWAALLRALR